MRLRFAPGFLGFGSNGGGELLAFDAAGRIVMLPMVGMSAHDAKLVAGSWSELDCGRRLWIGRLELQRAAGSATSGYIQGV